MPRWQKCKNVYWKEVGVEQIYTTAKSAPRCHTHVAVDAGLRGSTGQSRTGQPRHHAPVHACIFTRRLIKIQVRIIQYLYIYIRHTNPGFHEYRGTIVDTSRPTHTLESDARWVRTTLGKPTKLSRSPSGDSAPTTIPQHDHASQRPETIPIQAVTNKMRVAATPSVKNERGPPDTWRKNGIFYNAALAYHRFVR